MVRTAWLALLLAVLPVEASAEEEPSGLAVWPNAASRANSDDWLAAHHERLRQLRPALLVLNFCNGLAEKDGRAKVDRIAAALQEASRRHGYRDPQAVPFLRYQVFKYVDLADPPGGAAGGADGNSSRYPRVPGWKNGVNFQYAQLFGAAFARHYGVPDPRGPGRFLHLSELVERGLVHEVWFLAYQRQLGAPFECVEVKQAYDAAFQKIAGRSVQAGNGGDPGQPFIGRSLRILFVNAERGPGCALESFGHSMEGLAHSSAVPYFRRYFYEYAGFDLDRRYGLPFNSLYGRGQHPVSYPEPGALSYRGKDGQPRVLRGYEPIGGNVHFPPNGRQDYDLDNPQPVRSTIESWRTGNGPGGQDRAAPWTPRAYDRYRALAPDCMGPWLVYWWQNMPGADGAARDDEKKPMKCWWPFLFY